MTTKVPVLIVGGGPVGLAVAAELGWRGIACLLVERGDGAIHDPKVMQLNARTMEHCRRWGIARTVRNAGWPEDFPWSIFFRTAMTKPPFARYDMPSQRQMLPFAFGPEPRQRCPQQWFDPILADFAAGQPGVTLRYRTALEDFDSDADGVTATLVDQETGARETVRADWLAACDGAHSAIRDALGIGIEGPRLLSHNINVFFRAPALYAPDMKDDALMSILFDAEGQWGINTAVDGRTSWRITCITQERPEVGAVDASAIVRRLAGCDVDHEILCVNPWTRRQAVSERFRAGRVFLIGDSAHQLTPNGGFGMNTGIGDAVDFGWKLAAVIAGWGAPGLLASYEVERKPIADRNVREASRNFDQIRRIPGGPAMADDTEEGETLRCAARDFIYANNLARATNTTGIALGYRYEDSPVIVADGTPPPPDDASDYRPTARPGSRAPHGWIGDGVSTLDLFGRSMVLLDFGAGEDDRNKLAAAAESRFMPLAVERIVDEETADLYERRLALVRPDGHVAWRGDAAPDDPLALIDTVRGAAGNISSPAAPPT